MKILVLKIVLINIKINEKDLICEYNSDECYYEKNDMTVNQLELNVEQIGNNYSNYYTQSNQIVIIKNTSKTY